jgi:hypothetical protein
MQRTLGKRGIAMKKFLISSTIGILFFCAFPVMSLAENDESEPPVTKSETATIVFFRTGGVGGAVKFHVHNMAGEPLGYLGKSGDSFSIEIEPGTHGFWSRAASRSDVSLTVEAGKTYYVKATVKMGLAVGRPVLKEVPASKAPDSVK